MTNTWKCEVCKTGQAEGEMKSQETEDNGIKAEMLETCFVCKREVVTDTENIKTEPIKTEDIKKEVVDDCEVNMLEQNIDIALADRSLGLPVDASFVRNDEHQQKKLKLREHFDEETVDTAVNVSFEQCNKDYLQPSTGSNQNRQTENNTLSEEVVSSAQNDAIKTCVECNFVYTRPGSLKLHKIVHLSKPPYQCPHCEFKHRNTTDFNRHIFVHTLDTPYSCILCDSCFSQISALRRHLKRQHPNSAGIKCDQCGYTACHQTELDVHKDNFHSSAADIVVLKCDKCPFIYTKSDSLLLHKKVHESDPPYECSKCAYKGRHTTDYNKHVYTHTHDKPYSCIHCNRCFARPQNLHSHLKNVHSHLKSVHADSGRN